MPAPPYSAGTGHAEQPELGHLRQDDRDRTDVRDRARECAARPRAQPILDRAFEQTCDRRRDRSRSCQSFRHEAHGEHRGHSWLFDASLHAPPRASWLCVFVAGGYSRRNSTGAPTLRRAGRRRVRRATRTRVGQCCRRARRSRPAQSPSRSTRSGRWTVRRPSGAGRCRPPSAVRTTAGRDS